MEIFESLVPVGIVILCLAGAVALCALAYLLFSLKKTLDETMGKVNPLLDQVHLALDSAQPAIERVDPLMERIMLTVDAANLEIMRVDQILEDVNTITGNVSKATESIDTVTSLPAEAIGNITGRIREKLAPLGSHSNERVSAAASAVDQTLGCVEGKVTEAQAQADIKRAERDEAVAARQASQDQANQTSTNLKNAVASRVEDDTLDKSNF